MVTNSFRYNRAVSFDRELIEAKLALDLIASADMPSIAWDAWEAGVDGGPATRRLGSLERPTYFDELDQLLRGRARRRHCS